MSLEEIKRLIEDNNTTREQLVDCINWLIKESSSDSVKDEGLCSAYVNLFPKIRLNTGYYARVNIKELSPALNKFKKSFGFSDETILKATKLYVDYFSAKNYQYMKTSYYFIGKRGEPSLLAQYCEAVEEGVNSQEDLILYLGGKVV